MTFNDSIQVMNQQRKDQDKRRRETIETEWREFGEIRDRDLLFRIGFSSEEFFKEVISQHPAKRLADAVENIGIAFEILNRSRTAFVDQAGRFHARVVHGLHHGDDREQLLAEATKEVYTYSCAAASLVQAYRHIISCRPNVRESYDQLREEIFTDRRIGRFFSDLRNNNNHVHILIASPHYTITNRLKDADLRSRAASA